MTGGRLGDDRGTTGGRPGDDRGTTGGRPGDDRGTTGGRPEDDRGTTGGLPGDDRGMTGGRPGDDWVASATPVGRRQFAPHAHNTLSIDSIIAAVGCCCISTVHKLHALAFVAVIQHDCRSRRCAQNLTALRSSSWLRCSFCQIQHGGGTNKMADSRASQLRRAILLYY